MNSKILNLIFEILLIIVIIIVNGFNRVDAVAIDNDYFERYRK